MVGRHARRLAAASATPTFRATAAPPAAPSSQFVHIGPDETDTLAHIPAELAVPAPGCRRATWCSATTSTATARCSSTARAPSTSTGRARAARTTAASSPRPGSRSTTTTTPRSTIGRRVRRWRFDFADDADRVARTKRYVAAVGFMPEHNASADRTRRARHPSSRTRWADGETVTRGAADARRATSATTFVRCPERVRLDVDGAIATITNDNPDKHNAFDDDMDAQLFDDPRRAREPRPTSGRSIWRGEGKSFSSGRDVGSIGTHARSSCRTTS